MVKPKSAAAILGTFVWATPAEILSAVAAAPASSQSYNRNHCGEKEANSRLNGPAVYLTGPNRIKMIAHEVAV